MKHNQMKNKNKSKNKTIERKKNKKKRHQCEQTIKQANDQSWNTHLPVK